MNGESVKTGNSGEIPGDCSASAELKAARAITDLFVSAVEHYSGSPEAGVESGKSPGALYDRIADFTNIHGPLVLEVDGTLFRHRGHDLSDDSEAHETVAYSFHRDGIRILSFHQDLGEADLAEFLRIAAMRRDDEEAGGSDMVTDLWDAGLSGIRYGMDGNFRGSGPLLDIAGLKIPGMTPHFPASSPEPATDIDFESHDLEITRGMMAEAENRDADGEFLDVALEILKEPRGDDDPGELLAFIGESFRKLLSRGDFHRTGNFLKIFRRIRRECAGDRLTSMDGFLEAVSGSALETALSACLPDIDGENAEALRQMEEMLVQLSPECVAILGRMLPGIASAAVRGRVACAIRKLSAVDPRPLLQLAKDPRPSVSREALEILVLVEPRNHLPSILEAVNASDPSMRSAAVTALTRYQPPPYNVILPFIFDRDEAIREVVFRFLAQARQKETEKAIIAFLIDGEFTPAQQQPLLLLYRGLGCAGSGYSLEYLKIQLCSDPLRFNPPRAIHRLGAAEALIRLDDPEAGEILRKAARSIWPTVRGACRQALENDDGDGNPTG